MRILELIMSIILRYKYIPVLTVFFAKYGQKYGEILIIRIFAMSQ